MIGIIGLDLAQYQVVSIYHRQEFVPKVDNFPIKIQGILLPLLSAFN